MRVPIVPIAVRRLHPVGARPRPGLRVAVEDHLATHHPTLVV